MIHTTGPFTAEEFTDYVGGLAFDYEGGSLPSERFVRLVDDAVKALLGSKAAAKRVKAYAEDH